MAAAEKINASYVCRVLWLTLFAPNIVENVFDGRQPAEMTLAFLMKPLPVDFGYLDGVSYLTSLAILALILTKRWTRHSALIHRHLVRGGNDPKRRSD